MYTLFKRGEEIQLFDVQSEHVITTIPFNNKWITNPTLILFRQIGWNEYTPPEPEPYIPTLEELVELAIRNGLEEDLYEIHYSLNLEFHINRLMANENKTTEDINKWKKYNTFVERCIKWAQSQPHK